MKNILSVIIVSHGCRESPVLVSWLVMVLVVLTKLARLAVFLSHTRGGSVSCRHFCRQPGLALLLLFVTEVLKPSFDLNICTFLLLFQHEDHI